MRKTFDRSPPRPAFGMPTVAIRAIPEGAYGPEAPDIQGDWPDWPDPRDWLAAIIEGSDDAIISKDLNGVIRSWNHGASRLFGYDPKEAIGQPVTILIPEDRLDEEPAILAEIRAGKRVDHFETQRRRKDGTLVDISLTISPIRNRHGSVIGASKIARDIASRRQDEKQQQLHMGEMHHRVKNLFALASAIVSLSMRTAASVEEVPQLIQARMNSLARAHELTMQSWRCGDEGMCDTDLQTLLRTILEPYNVGDRIAISGGNPAVGSQSLTNLALILHELATNSAKYGALSVMEGRLTLHVSEIGDDVRLLWTETDGPGGAGDHQTQGFGSRLERGLGAALGATIERDWRNSGLVVTLTLPKAQMAG